MKTTERIKCGERGDGYIFKRPGSPYYYSAIYVGGWEQVESTETDDLAEAKKFHRHRVDEKSADRQGLKTFTTTAHKRMRVGMLLDDLEDFYTAHRPRSVKTIKCHIAHVRSFFGDRRALSLTEADGDRFVKSQRKDGASDGSIVLRLAYLCRALRRGKFRVPAFERPELDNVREGIFERAEIDAVVAHLPEHLKDVTRFGAACGWRKREILGLLWSHIDLHAGTIHLPPSRSKSKRGRTIAIMGDLVPIIERRRAARGLCPWVFHREGRPIGGDFRRAWMSACKQANVPGKLFHDLRRTSVTAMIRAGVDPGTAMKISGHRSLEVFRRYDIINTKDTGEALRKVSEYMNAQPVERSNVRTLRK